MGAEIKPFILSEGRHTLEDLKKLKTDEKIWKVSDIYEQQLRELFQISHPDLINSDDYEKKCVDFVARLIIPQKRGGFCGNWIYFSWSGNLVHMVGEEEYIKVRTNRNKNLITQEEQRELFAHPIGIVGLSVGNMIALSLSHNGIGGPLKIAEYDLLSTSNLNRIRAGVDKVGLSKIAITAQQIYEINPYAELILYDKGLDKETLSNFVSQDPKPRIIFEAIDDFEMKMRLRIEARTAGIPVIMLTSLGDNILIDVERYDQDKTLPIFHGLLGNLEKEIMVNPITEENKQRYAVQIVGKENVPERALQSVREVHKTLVGRPQLASSVTIAGGLAAYLARKILLNEPLTSGRKILRITDIV